MSVQIAAVRRLLSVGTLVATLAALTTPTALATTTRLAPKRSAVQAAAPRAIIFGGVTQQGWPVVLAVSPNGRRLRLAVIGVTVRCTSGASFGIDDGFIGLAINRQGKVHAARTGPTVTDSTGTTTGSDAMSGAFHPRLSTFTGWWRVQISYTSTATGQTDHCDSGRVPFSALL